MATPRLLPIAAVAAISLLACVASDPPNSFTDDEEPVSDSARPHRAEGDAHDHSPVPLEEAEVQSAPIDRGDAFAPDHGHTHGGNVTEIGRQVVTTDAITRLHGFAIDEAIPFEEHEAIAESLFATPPDVQSMAVGRVEDMVYSACTTSVIRQLSEQLIDEIQCLRPGTMSRIDDIPNVTLYSAVNAWMQTPAANALRRVGESGISVTLTSALRTLPQQYLLYRWYLAGRCGIGLAARPGTSNHESGLAIDTINYVSARSSLGARGYRWFGGSDPVHFDYVGGGGVSLTGLSVLAFQRLWNRNNPGDRISEDGVYGPATASRLARAPAGGFPIGSVCGAEPEPEPTPEPDPVVSRPDLSIETYWARQADGSYDLRALAPTEVVRVEYYVDGWQIGEATREEGSNFPDSYTFSSETNERYFEVRGYDSDGDYVALGDGLLDVTDGTAVFIRQLGDGLYDIGLERASSDVAFIEVSVDGWLLTDQVTGLTRVSRDRIRYTFGEAGEREFAITTYNADGTRRGTLNRLFEVTAGTWIAPPPPEEEEPVTIALSSPNRTAVNPVTFRVETTGDVASVAYLIDDRWEIGDISDVAANFALTYEFSVLGDRSITAIARDADGAELARTSAEVRVLEPASEPFVDFDFNPEDYDNPYTFTVLASDEVTRVTYVADSRWALGESSDAAGGFPLTYEFTNNGTRTLTAIAYDSGGGEVARDTISIQVGPEASEGTGVWLWYIDGTGLTHTQLADRLAALGVTRIYIKLADGSVNCGRWPELCDSRVPDIYQSRGIEAWGWSYNYPGRDDAQAEAIYLAAQSGYDGFVLDIEVEFNGTSTSLHNILGAFTRARERAVRDGHIPSVEAMPMNVTTWGNPETHRMRVDIIDQYVDAHMPQTYVEVWGTRAMQNPGEYVCRGTAEYRRLGARQPVNHIVSMEYDRISVSQVNEFLRTAGAGASVWRVPGTETPLSIWDDWYAMDWEHGEGTCE